VTAPQDSDATSQPIWARPDAFTAAPAGWGWIGPRGELHPCESAAALAAAICNDTDGSVGLVWTPENPHAVLPEEVAALADSLRSVRKRWAGEDLSATRKRLLQLAIASFGVLAWQFSKGIHALLGSSYSGIALLVVVIFGFIPWYQARKRQRELSSWDTAGMAAAVPVLRFETWLAQQTCPFTYGILGIFVCVALGQLFCHVRAEGLGTLLGIFQNWHGITEAGLLKDQAHRGEWWRLFTAPLLHGNLLHFLMNASAVTYLGKRLEVFARWPHLPLVFLIAAYAGGLASRNFVSAPSVGASGGLMGWLGFLLVFETLHARLVPRGARRRLAAGVLLTALIGLIGYRFVDNAAHVGGLLAGMIYAAIVFPKSSSVQRPASNLTDRIVGTLASLAIVAAASTTIYQLFR
jgi:membrane associated rhomboid family serine protease